MELFFTDAKRLDKAIVVDGKPLEVAGKPYVLPAVARSTFAAYAIPNGMPFMLEDDATYNRVVNGFLRALPAEGCPSRNTWKGYAFDLKTFRQFLAQEPDKPDLLFVEKHHLDKYATVRRVDVNPAGREHRVLPSTWNRAIMALDKFYTIAAQRDSRVKVPFTYKDIVVPMEGGGRFATRRNNALSREGDKGVIKCISLDDYLLFRNHGLLGKGLTDNSSPDFKGRHKLRNSAFAELGITTGTRLEENASILLAELPDPFAPRWQQYRSCCMQLGRLTTKGNKGRKIWVPKRVLIEYLLPYIEEDRDNAVAQALQDGTYRTIQDPILIRSWGTNSCICIGPDKARYEYDNLAYQDRGRFYSADTEDQPCEPGRLWLTEQGLPTEMPNFNAIFARACKRLREQGGIDLDVTPHTLRHTFAVYMLSHLIEETFEGLSNLRSEKRKVSQNAYSALVRDPLRRLQKLLGHASSETTQIYLTYVEEADEIVDRAIGSWSDRLGRPLDHMQMEGSDANE